MRVWSKMVSVASQNEERGPFRAGEVAASGERYVCGNKDCVHGTTSHGPGYQVSIRRMFHSRGDEDTQIAKYWKYCPICVSEIFPIPQRLKIECHGHLLTCRKCRQASQSVKRGVPDKAAKCTKKQCKKFSIRPAKARVTPIE